MTDQTTDRQTDQSTNQVFYKDPRSGREFKNKEELDSFMSQSSYSNVQAQSTLLSTETTQSAISGYEPAKKKPMPDFLDDPNGWAERVRTDAAESAQSIVSKADKERQQKEDLQRFYDDLFKQNPDLQKHRWVVETELNQNFNTQYAKLSVSQAMNALVTNSRSKIGSILKEAGVQEKELQSGDAAIIGSSGEPGKTQATPVKTTTFVDELLAQREKRRKQA